MTVQRSSFTRALELMVPSDINSAAAAAVRLFLSAKDPDVPRVEQDVANTLLDAIGERYCGDLALSNNPNAMFAGKGSQEADAGLDQTATDLPQLQN